MLFAIEPVRPRNDVSLCLRVDGIQANHLPKQPFLQKLGGEGKLAGIVVSEADLIMPEAQVTIDGEKIHFKLVFTQPALMPVDGWLPEGFKQSEEQDCWEGQLNNCPVTLVSACIGKPVKLGGWDLKSHQSKMHQSYIPAGSVYFFEAHKQDRDAILKLHDTKLGENCPYGFGHVLLGRW